MAVLGLKGALTEVSNAAETGGVNAEEILKADDFVDAKREKSQSRPVKTCTLCWRGTRTPKRRGSRGP